jgi:hypothetical protein
LFFGRYVLNFFHGIFLPFHYDIGLLYLYAG